MGWSILLTDGPHTVLHIRKSTGVEHTVDAPSCVLAVSALPVVIQRYAKRSSTAATYYQIIRALAIKGVHPDMLCTDT